jgi:hypothetical protein
VAVHSLPALLPLVVPIAASTFVTALISGTFGMAGGMILMAVLLQLLPLAVAQTLHAAVQLVSNGWRCWLWRKHIVWRVLPFYAFGAAFGFSLVVTLKFVPDKAAVLMMIGVVPLISMAVRKVLVRGGDPDVCAYDRRRGRRASGLALQQHRSDPSPDHRHQSLYANLLAYSPAGLFWNAGLRFDGQDCVARRSGDYPDCFLSGHGHRRYDIGYIFAPSFERP